MCDIAGPWIINGMVLGRYFEHSDMKSFAFLVSAFSASEDLLVAGHGLKSHLRFNEAQISIMLPKLSAFVSASKADYKPQADDFSKIDDQPIYSCMLLYPFCGAMSRMALAMLTVLRAVTYLDLVSYFQNQTPTLVKTQGPLAKYLDGPDIFIGQYECILIQPAHMNATSSDLASTSNGLPLSLLDAEEAIADSLILHTHSKHAKRLVLACSGQIVQKIKYCFIKLMDTCSRGQMQLYSQIMMNQTRKLFGDDEIYLHTSVKVILQAFPSSIFSFLGGPVQYGLYEESYLASFCSQITGEKYLFIHNMLLLKISCQHAFGLSLTFANSGPWTNYHLVDVLLSLFIYIAVTLLYCKDICKKPCNDPDIEGEKDPISKTVMATLPSCHQTGEMYPTCRTLFAAHAGHSKLLFLIQNCIDRLPNVVLPCPLVSGLQSACFDKPHLGISDTEQTLVVSWSSSSLDTQSDTQDTPGSRCSQDSNLSESPHVQGPLILLGEFPLTPMGVLAPGSAHARPSAQPPIDVSGNFSAHVSAVCKILKQKF